MGFKLSPKDTPLPDTLARLPGKDLHPHTFQVGPAQPLRPEVPSRIAGAEVLVALFPKAVRFFSLLPLLILSTNTQTERNNQQNQGGLPGRLQAPGRQARGGGAGLPESVGPAPARGFSPVGTELGRGGRGAGWALKGQSAGPGGGLEEAGTFGVGGAMGGGGSGNAERGGRGGSVRGEGEWGRARDGRVGERGGGEAGEGARPAGGGEAGRCARLARRPPRGIVRRRGGRGVAR